MPFEFERLKIKDVILIKPKIFMDERGFFMETYKREDFEKAGIRGEFLQDNHSRSRKGVLRGLHFQLEPYAQAKIVRCVRGEIYDVAVDLRKGSLTFGKYVGMILSEENGYELYIPRGFAHGFVVLSDVADVVYKVDNKYSPEHECGLIWNDKDVGIDWPFSSPILSSKDRSWPTLKELIESGKTFR